MYGAGRVSLGSVRPRPQAARALLLFSVVRRSAPTARFARHSVRASRDPTRAPLLVLVRPGDGALVLRRYHQSAAAPLLSGYHGVGNESGTYEIVCQVSVAHFKQGSRVGVATMLGGKSCQGNLKAFQFQELQPRRSHHRLCESLHLANIRHTTTYTRGHQAFAHTPRRAHTEHR